jgi:hypothetical protein
MDAASAARGVALGSDIQEISVDGRKLHAGSSLGRARSGSAKNLTSGEQLQSSPL